MKFFGFVLGLYLVAMAAYSIMTGRWQAGVVDATLLYFVLAVNIEKPGQP